MPDFSASIHEILPELVAFRHDLHRHPELAYEEHRTSAHVQAELRQIPGLSVQNGVAGTGVVALLNADKPGRCVALRADMDALPIHEGSDLPYRSTIDGRMHACGHDGHTACLLGAARVLAKHAEEMPGKVKFIFQPAEERGAGGRMMVDQGVLDDPPVDAAFALHGWPDTEVGGVVVGRGPILAAAGAFEVDLHGKGTHAAYPHRGTDLIVAASYIVTRLQVIASRFTDPLDPVVVSIGAFHAGQTHNVLPDHCRLMGTIRTLSVETFERVKFYVEQIVQSVAADFGAEVELTHHEAYPALINDAGAARIVADVAHELLGPEHIDQSPPASLGGEDFAFMAERVPSAMWRLGVRPPGMDDYPKLHHPKFDFGDGPISIGVAMHCHIAQRFLEHGFPV